MCFSGMVALWRRYGSFFLWTEETGPFSSASSSVSESSEKEKKKPLDFRNLEQLPRGWKAMWMNDSSMGRSSTGQTVKGGALAETSLLCSSFWCGCSSVPSYSRGCFVTDHLAAAPGSTAYLLQPEGDGISCWFHQDLPAWHIQTAAG